MIFFRSIFCIAILLCSISSFSCSCHNDIEEMNMSRYNDCAAVFIGQPDSLGECVKGKTIRFRIEKLYKGTISGNVTVKGILCSGSCAFDFQKENKYLIYLYPDSENNLSILPCTGTRKIMDQQDISVMMEEAKKFNTTAYLEEELKIWEHEIELLEKLSSHPNGKPRTNYLNGKSTGEGRMENGLPVGEWTYYYPNGNIKAVGHYDKGKKTGYWVEYTTYFATYEDTAATERKRYLLRNSGRYEDGHKEGKWERINLDGSVITLFYRRGKFVTDKPEKQK